MEIGQNSEAEFQASKLNAMNSKESGAATAETQAKNSNYIDRTSARLADHTLEQAQNKDPRAPESLGADALSYAKNTIKTSTAEFQVNVVNLEASKLLSPEEGAKLAGELSAAESAFNEKVNLIAATTTDPKALKESLTLAYQSYAKEVAEAQGIIEAKQAKADPNQSPKLNDRSRERDVIQKIAKAGEDLRVAAYQKSIDAAIVIEATERGKATPELQAQLSDVFPGTLRSV
jgi:hypothetical protein